MLRLYESYVDEGKMTQYSITKDFITSQDLYFMTEAAAVMGRNCTWTETANL